MLGRNNSANIHAWVEARLSEYVDNQLAANERAQIEEHLRGCADCRASFESLRWTIALVKQAPAPALPRAFTLAVPEKHAPQKSFAFGLAQFATALATLLLLAVIGVDVITQFGGGTMATAPSAAKQYAAPTLAVAAVPATVAPAPTTVARDQASEAAKPTQAPKPAAPPAAPTAAPMPTMAPAAALPAPLNVLPTATAPRSVAGAAPETPEPKGATTDTTAKSSSATPALRSGFAITVTATIPPPTATIAPTVTATSVPPTATTLSSPTIVAQARVEATRALQPTPVPLASVQSPITPVRVVEFGLLFLVILFGAAVVVMWRRK
jgi:hypothetical protein